MAEPVFFPDAAAWLAWLEAHHDGADEILVGFARAGAKTRTKTGANTADGRPGFTYRDALEGALAYGWIDGVRRSLGEAGWTIRFTPRKPGSAWSRVNLAHAERLKAEGRMRPPGLAAYEERDRRRDSPYSFEQESWQLDAAAEAAFRAEPAAWDFFCRQPLSYRRPASWWVMSAKRAETRQRRLATLIADAAAGRRIASLARPARPSRKD